MAYRHAYRWLLLLFPLTLLAFWPSYFSKLTTSSWVFHAHGITASLWIVLTALQSWSIGNGSRSLHRSAGQASLALFPLFFTGGLLILRFQAAGFAASDGGFHIAYGAPLTSVDLITSAAALFLYYTALRWRAKMLVHAAAMLAIPLFLIPPILGRAMQAIPFFGIHSADQVWRFAMDLHICNVISAAIALYLYAKRPRTAWPLGLAAAAILLQSLAFASIGVTAAWASVVRILATIPQGAVVVGGLLLAGVVVWAGWRGGRRSARPAAHEQGFEAALTT